jgi:uncharacterized protein (TIGR03437 family)
LNAFVTKLTPAGNALAYSTYLGGSGTDAAYGIAVDAAGSAYVTGSATSTNFPTTRSAYQTSIPGPSSVFVTKLAATGQALAYSTYLGGNTDDYGAGIAVDAAGSAYVTGYTASSNFPIQSPYQASYQGGPVSGPDDAFATKLNPTGSGVVFSTYLGGNGTDFAAGIAVDGAGSAYVVGTTTSLNFPIQSPFQPGLPGTEDPFVTKLQLPVAVATNPPGLAIVVDGATLTAPQAFDWILGTNHTITATSPQQSGGTSYVFASWSDGGAQSHTIAAYSSAATYTATFTAVGSTISGVVDSASFRPTIAPNSFVTIYGSSFTSSTEDWSGSAPNGVLPTTLGGVQVLIDGKACFVNYVSPTQLNVLTPSDTASGTVSVEAITAQGTVTSTVFMAPVAPALFGYTLSSGRFYAVAQIANTTTIVAPVGTFGSAPSRPAQADDYVVLYAIGMGSTNPAAPVGVVLPTAYPVTDLSSVKVTFGSVPATVSWAGMVYAGEFQVNVQVPPGLSGDEPVVMTVGGQSTQPKAYLNFQ